MKKTVSLALVMFMVVSAFAGCAKPTSITESQVSSTSISSSSNAEDPNSTGYLKLSVNVRKGEALDSKLSSPWQQPASHLLQKVFRGLLMTNEDLEAEFNDLAEDYEISADGLTYTFTIRDGVKWHDGVAFSVDDVIFSIKACLKSTTVYGFYTTSLLMIEGASAFQKGDAEDVSGITVDGNKITFKLTKQYGNFKVFWGEFMIYPEHCLKDEDFSVMQQSAFWDAPIGTGPYKVTEVVPSNYAVLEVNEDFYGKIPKIKKIVLTWYEDEANVAAVMNGDVDWWYTEDRATAETITKNNPDIKVYEVNSYFVRGLAANMNPATDDPDYVTDILKKDVRVALSEAIDRKTMVEQLYPGQGKAMATMCAIMTGVDESIAIPEFDAAKSKKALEDAGFDFSKTIRLAYYYTDQLGIDTAEFIANCWKQCGVKVETILWSTDVANQLNIVRHYEFCYAGFAGLFPVDFICNYHDSKNAAQNTRYGKEILAFMASTYDATIAKYNSETDSAKKLQLGYELQQINSKNIIDIPLYSLSTYYMVNTKTLDCTGPFGNSKTDYNRYYENWSLK